MITSQLVGAAVAITLAWLTSFAYWALAFQVLASSITAAILSWLICTWRPSLLFNWQSCRVETRFGLHMTGFSVTNYFHRQMDNVLIGHRWGAQELGFYSRSYNLLLTPISIVNAAIGQVVVPLLSRHQDNSEEWRHYLLVSLAFTCFGCSGISAVLVANADSIVRVVLGPGWDYSAKIFFYLGLSLFAMAPMNAMGWVFMSLGQTDRWFRWGLFTAVIFPITFLIGLPFHAIGVAQAYSVAVTLIAFPCIMYALRKAPASAMDVARTVRAPLIAGFVTVGLLASTGLVDRMHLAPPLALIIGCSLAGLMFLFLALLLLFMDPAQRPQREIFLRLLRAGRGRLLPNHTS